jgi:hypothetical protein
MTLFGKAGDTCTLVDVLLTFLPEPSIDIPDLSSSALLESAGSRRSA